MSTRTEYDSMGPVEVDSNAYYGAQTVRSLHHFKIGEEKLSSDFIKNYAVLKLAAAQANNQFGKLTQANTQLICDAAREIVNNNLLDQFPLSVWQTGSGTQSNMNVNEVISNRANELAGEKKGTKSPIHPNDHVNLSQSSNDTFPTVMYMTAHHALTHYLLPALNEFKKTLQDKIKTFDGIIKIGRTHLQDATPLKLSQEYSAFLYLIENSIDAIHKSLEGLELLAIGGTAVGTGINAPDGFDESVCHFINAELKTNFKPHPNKFAVLSAHDELVHSAHCLSTLAGSLLKMANDIRWSGSGPRCGIGEISLPENEPGSSIMPGKVNPTQCEALTMIALQVKGLVSAIDIAGSQGNFQLNVFKPMMIYNFENAVRLLSDGLFHFNEFCLKGLKANEDRIASLVHNSLMLVTALTPILGYDKSAEIAHHALVNNLTLKEACLTLGYLPAEVFDKAIDLEKMTS